MAPVAIGFVLAGIAGAAGMLPDATTRSAAQAGVASPAAAASTLADAPESLQQAVKAAVQQDTYRLAPAGEGRYIGSNPAHGVEVTFSASGPLFTGAPPDAWTFGLSLEAFGYAGHLAPVAPATPVLAGDRLEYHRGDVTEWYINDHRGVEQGFTVAAPPLGGRSGAHLEVVLDVRGSLAPRLEGGNVVLSSGSGGAVLGYSNLVTTDASGARLPSRMELRDGAIVLVVDDAGATYPVTIDPLVADEQAKLLAGDPAARVEQLGFSVALSGETAIVGAPLDDAAAGADAGAAYVFVRSGTVWNQQARLTPSDAAESDEFGHSVALRGDTAIVGAPFDDTAAGADAGSAYVFMRDGHGRWSEQEKLTASDGSGQFGRALAFEGSTALIGAPRDDTAGSDAGSAYVFVRDEDGRWSQQGELVFSDAAESDGFGHSVALSGDTALVGAPFDDTAAGWNAGSAHVFVRQGDGRWDEEANLTAGPAAVESDHFGHAVALSGNSALIGAPLKGHSSKFETGMVFALERWGTSWVEVDRLRSLDPDHFDHFGWSLALEGDTALVGAPSDDTRTSFVRVLLAAGGGQWSYETRLTPSDPDEGDAFGSTVAVSGDSAIVGAPLHDDRNTGSAYAFLLTGRDASGAEYEWSEQAKLRALDPAAGPDQFGWSVALDGDTALVGARLDDTPAGPDAGSAYVFVRSGTTWSQQAKLTAPDAAAGDHFGWSVALDGDTALVGAPLNDTRAGPDVGSAHVFVRSGTTWSQLRELSPRLGHEGDHFGHSVALDGDTALVGAPFDDSSGVDAGSVHVFHWMETFDGDFEWLHWRELTRSGVGQFGFSIALSGDTAVIATVVDRSLPGAAGSAIVFVRSSPGTTWSAQAKLTASHDATGDDFGHSVALDGDGDTALVGVRRDDIAGFNSGSAYVFARSGTTWSRQAVLTAPDAAIDDLFGASVALSADTALVGSASHDTSAGPNAGSAYVFARSGTTWSQQAKLTASDAGSGDRFGASVALSADSALVGAPLDDTMDADAGAVYGFGLTATNAPPDVSLSGPIGVAEGDTHRYTYTASDPDGDPLEVSESCGAHAARTDTPEPHSFDCTFPDGPATSTVTVTADDGDATVSESRSVDVENVAPTVTMSEANPVAVEEGATHTYVYAISDPGADTVASTTTSCGAFGSKVAGSEGHTDASGTFDCTFPDGPQTSTVTVAVTDSDDATGAPGSQVVDVANVAPTLSWVASPGSADEGQERTYEFTVTDPGQDAFSPAPGYPDCGVDGPAVLLDTTVSSASFQCSFPDGPASPTVTVTVTDSDGTVSNDLAQAVEVSNVAPTADAGGPYEGAWATAIGLDAGATSDPAGSHDTLRYEWDFDYTTTFTPTGSGASPTHSYASPGRYTAALRASDEDGGVSPLATATVTVTRRQTTLAFAPGSDGSAQYSDDATVSTRLLDDVSGESLADRAVTFAIETQSERALTDASGIAAAAIRIDQAAGSPGASASFAGDALYTQSSTSVSFVVAHEDAALDYTGETIAQVGTALDLRTTVWDSAATSYPDGAGDATVGDITNMWVAFDVYSGTGCETLRETRYAQVSDGAATGDGVGLATETLTSTTEETLCITPRLVASPAGEANQFYVAPPNQPAVVAFYENTGQSVFAGGSVDDPDGGKGNLRLSARHNKRGQPQGRMTYVYPGSYNGTIVDYRIESDALNAVAFSGDTHPVMATLEGEATIQIVDAATGAELYSDGAATFTATATDTDNGGAQEDTFSLRVWDRAGEPYKLVAERPLASGTVAVRP